MSQTNQPDLRSRLKKALKAAAANDLQEDAEPRGCCTITSGNVVEQRNDVKQSKCQELAEIFGGVAKFQANSEC